MPTKTIPLIGSYTNRSYGVFTNKDQEFINCFPEVVGNSITQARSAWIVRRTGFILGGRTGILSSDLSSYGACVWSSKADGTMPAIMSWIKSDSTLTKIYRVQTTTGNMTQVGGDIASTSNCFFLTETLVSGTSNITGIFSDNSTGAYEYWYFPEGGAWTQITDGDFPPNIGTPEPLTPYITHLDGYTFVMTTNGKIWNSDVNSIANWTASSFITAQSQPDNGTAIARYKDYIIGCGSRSIEFFYNAGNPTGSVLSPVANSTINIGVLPATNGISQIKEVGDTLYFIGRDLASGQVGAYRLEGNSAKKVSTQSVDKMFDPYYTGGAVNGICGVIYTMGKRHVLFSGPTSCTKQLAYCIDNDFWWTFSLSSQAAPVKGAITGNNADGGQMTTFINNYSDVYRAYYMNSSSDGGENVPVTVRTSGLDFDTDEHKFVSDIWLDADTESAGTVTLEKSDDDYGSWQTLGTFDLTKHEKRITRCGSHTGERAYRLTHSALTSFRAKSLRIKYTTST